MQPFTLRQWMDSLGGERDAVVKDIIKLIQDGVFQPIAGKSQRPLFHSVMSD